MKNFQDKVAVVTGAASGIGRALAVRSAQEGMRVVLADVEDEALAQTEAQMRSSGAVVMAVHTDVSKYEQVTALAEKARVEFGSVDLLFNNAGVGAGGSTWESSLADWEWVLGVNVWGVIHGLQAFVPQMLAQNSEGYIVNTASVAGLLSYHPSAPYQVSKHAIVSLSEHLYYTLKLSKAKLHAALICPGWVQTRIMESERNRPTELRNPIQPVGPEVEAVLESMRKDVQAGLAPEQVAEKTFEAIRENKFYILTSPELMPLVQGRMTHLVQGLNPPDFA